MDTRTLRLAAGLALLAGLSTGASAATYTATCQGQTVSASSLAAFGPKCTNIRTVTPVTPTAPPKAVTPTAPFDPYKNLYTVQGWANAYKTYGVGNAGSSPYYAAAVQKSVVYDANGNFLQAKNLGSTTKIGSTTYVQSGSTVVNGVTVYTYTKK
ncbi:hypothetical protein AACH10_07885 [Ideonella sp. DXS22W]|uniref:Uncharacterized protein n=1 Tax=Pseudaquabacterium inlustre TaxID=2984192 RepID=A0ABU9CE48_9BURK